MVEVGPRRLQLAGVILIDAALIGKLNGMNQILLLGIGGGTATGGLAEGLDAGAAAGFSRAGAFAWGCFA